MATSSSHVGKILELKSPFGEESMTYKWPLKKGKGSVRRSEDKEDEAAEILETVRCVGSDHPEVNEMLDKNGVFGKYDPTSYEAMDAFCEAYNKSIEKYLANKKKGTAKPNPNFKKRCTRPLLKHILQSCYNKSVTDPNLLNHYEAFTPEVYGETSFELICQILDKLHPISSDNKFVDLGSGVGQVVLQVAALTECESSFGIEKANTPANYAKELERWFKFWMKFYGKTYSKFRLVHGDFLDKQHRENIENSTIVFVNNFAFGPEVDQHLKDIFADLKDGARIFSSKSFCALNFRITDRNLSDIGTIMHVSKMDPLKGSVSWTGKPVSYYLHVIDRARLERYFQKSAARNQEEGRRRGRHRGNGEIEDSSLDVSMDTSRASSVEHDVGSLSLTETSKKSLSDDEDAFDEHKPRRRGRKGKLNNQKQRPATVISLRKQPSMGEDSNDIPMTDSASSTPPPSSSNSLTSENNRPVRTAAATANAISEAQSEMKNKKFGQGGPGGRRKKNAQIAARISGLDLLHDTTMSCIEASNKDVSAPAGCVNERLNSDHPRTLVHEELTTSLTAGDDGKPIPFQLQVHLDKLKRQYLSFIKHMQDPTFKERIKADIEIEKKKKQDLIRREKQLKSQIDNLITDSLNLLKTRLSELGIQAKTPPEFIEKAKGIVCQHHELQRNKISVENEVRQLELEQEKIIQSKEKEMLEHLLKQGLSMSEARRRVKITIENTINSLQGAENKVSPLLNKLADVTLTKCEQLPSSTQIRKRPVIAKQRDWPEKKIVKDEGQWNAEMAKIEEKNPEVLAKKIIAQGRCLEKSKSAMLLSPRSKESSMPRGTVEVEVRRIEQQQQQPPQPQAKSELPRMMDLTSTLINVQNQQRSNEVNNGQNEQPLVLPPHPGSRSSEQTEEITFPTNKMSSTPRAEQFENRLKSIIHSVLSGDDDKDVKPQVSQNKPMFSPVKKELPTHLPLPPSGIVQKRTLPTASSGVTLPQMTMGSARTMNEIIEKEIERSSLSGNEPRRMPAVSPMSPQKLVRPPPTSASTMSRMSQVIEDSLRGRQDQRPGELEGLACPRTKSPPPPPPSGPLGVPTSSSSGSGPKVPFRHNGDDFHHDYPAMEGLSARFNSFMAKAPDGPKMMDSRAYPKAPSNWDGQHPNNSYRYPPTGPSFPPQQPPPMGYGSAAVPPRKRASPSSSMALPPKKQHMDSTGIDYSFHKDEESGKKWQDEINSGFDRLVAYATEVDKRRKSTDSSNNSPARPSSGLSHEDLNSASNIDDVFEGRNNSYMSMKFKNNPVVSVATSMAFSGPRGVVSANSPYARTMPVHSSSKSHVPSALASIASLDDLQNPKSPLPGENLPEHHFKKRYFAENANGSPPQSSSSPL